MSDVPKEVLNYGIFNSIRDRLDSQVLNQAVVPMGFRGKWNMCLCGFNEVEELRVINYKIYIDKEWSKESTAYVLGFF